MLKHNALGLRWDWYEESQNGWHPSATEVIKDFILWVYGNNGEIMGTKSFPERRNNGKRPNGA